MTETTEPGNTPARHGGPPPYPAAEFAAALGPRQLGGIYHHHYWRRSYTVLDISDRDPQTGWALTVEWHDNGPGPQPTRHCTPWDPRDQIIHQPTPHATATARRRLTELADHF
ncbi:hypothetical protein [Nocardia suismassiliense]|uniref:hypothetical protein n=1 Tax=Nocardia suismassiliense TaxID=2077092 RepID=UPI000D1F0704|nr:hypothetical protein [Nocardia suismassiliense]